MKPFLQKSVQEAGALIAAHRVVVAPALVAIDPTMRTASVELQNRSTDTLDAELTVGTTPPAAGFGRAVPDSAAKAVQGDASPLVADEHTNPGADPATHAGKDVAASQSLVPWVRGLPAHVRLAPGEKKTILVKLDVPAARAAGDYAAWLLVTTTFSGTTAQPKAAVTDRLDAAQAPLQVRIMGGPVRLQSGVRLTYHAE